MNNKNMHYLSQKCSLQPETCFVVNFNRSCHCKPQRATGLSVSNEAYMWYLMV